MAVHIDQISVFFRAMHFIVKVTRINAEVEILELQRVVLWTSFAVHYHCSQGALGIAFRKLLSTADNLIGEMRSVRTHLDPRDIGGAILGLA